MPASSSSILAPPEAELLPELLSFLKRTRTGRPHTGLRGNRGQDLRWVRLWSGQVALLVLSFEIQRAILQSPHCRINVPVEACTFANGLRPDESPLRANGAEHRAMRALTDPVLGRMNPELRSTLLVEAPKLVAAMDGETDLVAYVTTLQNLGMMHELGLTQTGLSRVIRNASPGQDVFRGNNRNLMEVTWESIGAHADEMTKAALGSEPTEAAFSRLAHAFHAAGFAPNAISAQLGTLETGRGSIAGPLLYVMWQLARDPQLWTTFREHRELRRPIMRELMRLYGHYSLLNTRVLDVDLVLEDGRVIPAGTLLIISTTGSLTDPAVYSRPDRLDLAQTSIGLAFGGDPSINPHACPALGPSLNEMAIALDALADQLQRLQFVQVRRGAANLLPEIKKLIVLPRTGLTGPAPSIT